ncbi:MAG: hypothetical protein ABH834_01395 [Candidatus Altiarchaeota archaeon]
MEDDVTAPSAVEAIHEKQKKKLRISPKLLFVIPLLIVFLIVLRSFWTGEGDQPDFNATSTTTLTPVNLHEKAPLKTPDGYNLTNVSERWAAFKWGSLFYPVNGTEMVLDKQMKTYNIYVARGTVDGWKKILTQTKVTVEENISPLVYSAPYRYGQETITFIFWRNNDRIIALNGTGKTQEQFALARKMIYLYPPTEKLV